MPEKKLATLFLEIFVITVILATLASIALPHVSWTVGSDGSAGQFGRVAGVEPTCSTNNTLHDYFQDLLDFPRGFDTAGR
jgi:hypothetical protein